MVVERWCGANGLNARTMTYYRQPDLNVACIVNSVDGPASIV